MNKRLEALVTNTLFGRLATTPNDFEEHFYSLSIDDIIEISTSKKSKWYEKLDIIEEEISTEMIKMCINTLNSDAMTPEKESLGYLTYNKLKNLK